MTKLTFFFGLLWLSFTCCGQTTTVMTSKPLTLKYAGTYCFGTNIEKGSVGTIFIYPEADSTILFYIYINRGAPSYNMGSLYGRLKIVNDTGTFFNKFDFSDNGCKLTFKFSKRSLTIITDDNHYECGFGHAVFADGYFKQISGKILDYFENDEGTRVYFKTTTPEDYYK
jgi:hypothetical protein